jgi:hypothetical protein
MAKEEGGARVIPRLSMAPFAPKTRAETREAVARRTVGRHALLLFSLGATRARHHRVQFAQPSDVLVQLVDALAALQDVI